MMRYEIIFSALLSVFVNGIGSELISEHRKKQSERHNGHFRLSTSEAQKAKPMVGITKKSTEPKDINVNQTSCKNMSILVDSEEKHPVPPPIEKILPTGKSQINEDPLIPTTKLLEKNTPSHGNSSHGIDSTEPKDINVNQTSSKNVSKILINSKEKTYAPPPIERILPIGESQTEEDPPILTTEKNTSSQGLDSTEPKDTNVSQINSKNMSKILGHSDEKPPVPPPIERILPIGESQTNENPPIPTTEPLEKNTPSHGIDSPTDILVTTEVQQSTSESEFSFQIGSAAIASLAGGGIG